MTKKVKAVFFDFGGTLDSNGLAWRPRFFKIYKKYFPSLSLENFNPAFFDSDDNLSKKHNLNAMGFEGTLRAQTADVFSFLKIIDKPSEKKITDEFLMDSRKNFRAAKKVLERLKSKKMKLGVISNFYGNLKRVLKSEGLLEYFDAVADSSEIGAIKPDKKIFLWSLTEIGTKPSESAMVGDSVMRDMRGAENMNMPHFWIKSDEVNLPVCCDEAVVIKTLPELEGKLQILNSE